MKAKELIEKLQKADPELDAIISIFGVRDNGKCIYWVNGIDCVWTETDCDGKVYLYIGQLDTASTELTIDEL